MKLDSASIGSLEVYKRLINMEYGTFTPVKDKGIDVVGFSPRKNKFIALQIKTSKRYFDRYKAKDSQYGYWWEISNSIHDDIKGNNVFYVLVGLQFDIKDRNIIDFDFFIINSSVLDDFFKKGLFKYDKNNKKWRLEVYLDDVSKRFLSYHDPECDLSPYLNSWDLIK